MESEKGWAVWSKDDARILFYTISRNESSSFERVSLGEALSVESLEKQGYRLVEVTISYEKPGASDGK